MTYGNTWKHIGHRLLSTELCSGLVHRIQIDWDDSAGAQHYAYKAYGKDSNLIEEGPVSDVVPIHHSADDRTLVSALIWVGFGLETAVHRSDCVVCTTDDNIQAKRVIWERPNRKAV